MGRVVGYSRSGNLALLVRTLREHGALSRAQLAVRSGLSKATVSTLVSDLELRGLVHSAGVSAGGQGRPGQLVDLRPRSVCGVGLDIHVGHVGVAVVDLAGGVAQLGHQLLAEVRSAVYRRSLPLATGNLPIVLSELGETAGVIGAAWSATDRAFTLSS